MTAAIAIYDDRPEISFAPLWAFLTAVMAVVAGYFMADDDSSDLEDDGEDYLSDEERAALEDEDGNENDTEGGDGGEEDDDESDQGGDGDQGDGERGEDDVQDGNPDDKEADPDAQTDTDQNKGESSDSQGGDSEDDENQDKEKETPAAADDAGTGTGDVDPEPTYEQKLKELDQKLDDGKIEFDDYKKELRELEHSRTQELVRQEVQRVKAEDTWQAEQRAFFAANESLSPGKANPIVYNAFAGEVNRLAADKAWASRSGADLLAEAKKNVEAAFGLKSEGKDPDPPPKKKEKTDGQKAVEKAKKFNAIQDSPQTLKNVPASDKNTDNPFGHLDNLDGAEYEAAWSKLSSAEREAYENSL